MQLIKVATTSSTRKYGDHKVLYNNNKNTNKKNVGNGDASDYTVSLIRFIRFIRK